MRKDVDMHSNRKPLQNRPWGDMDIREMDATGTIFVTSNMRERTGWKQLRVMLNDMHL
jgi:hypothetical protein